VEAVQRATLSIDGMSCGHCVKAVSQALRKLPGVDVEQVAIGSATVAYDPSATSLDEIVDAVSDEGYGASLQLS
jgi:copper chaperone CopZ